MTNSASPTHPSAPLFALHGALENAEVQRFAHLLRGPLSRTSASGLAELSGRLSGSFDVAGHLHAPTVNLLLEGQEMTVGAADLGTLSLQASLSRHRDAVVWKLQGLNDTELRRAMLPSGDTLLGLVKHLATWEYIWICRTFGHPTEQLPFEEGDDDADVRIEPGDSTADILAFYSWSRRQPIG